jgi:hypothetical protein
MPRMKLHFRTIVEPGILVINYVRMQSMDKGTSSADPSPSAARPSSDPSASAARPSASPSAMADVTNKRCLASRDSAPKRKVAKPTSKVDAQASKHYSKTNKMSEPKVLSSLRCPAMPEPWL